MPLQIGGRDGATLTFVGVIDDVRFYKRNLNDAEVRQLFHFGVQRLVRVPVETRSPEQEALLTATFLSNNRDILTEMDATKKRNSQNSSRWENVRRWYLNSQGQTMVVIPNPSRNGFDDRIDYDFAISSHEVTAEEFLRFDETHLVDKNVTPSNECPVSYINLYDVAAYCNWLSDQEGVPKSQWVYLKNDDGQYAAGMKVKEEYRELSGYRLPTTVEWEFAARSHAKSNYCFGYPIALLGNYASYAANSQCRTLPRGSLLPNEFGLFDMHGNVWEWCQPERGEDERYPLRGGSVSAHGHAVSFNDHTNSLVPGDQYPENGFRITRSLP